MPICEQEDVYARLHIPSKQEYTEKMVIKSIQSKYWLCRILYFVGLTYHVFYPTFFLLIFQCLWNVVTWKTKPSTHPLAWIIWCCSRKIKVTCSVILMACRNPPQNTLNIKKILVWEKKRSRGELHADRWTDRHTEKRTTHKDDSAFPTTQCTLYTHQYLYLATFQASNMYIVFQKMYRRKSVSVPSAQSQV